MAPSDHRDVAASKTSVPVVEEQIHVGSHEVPTGRVVVNKIVEERNELVDVLLAAENYRIERVPLNLTVDAPPAVRRVGDTTIIPVIEEVAVVNKQLVVREELHITRVRSEVRRPQRVSLKRERVDVMMMPAQQSEKNNEFNDPGEVLMAKTIVGLFDDKQKAQTVMRELANAGIVQTDIHCISLNGGMAAGTDVAGRLMRAGVPTEEVRHYSSEVENGKSVLVIKASDQAIEPAVTVLERYGAKDLDQRREAAAPGLSGNERQPKVDAESATRTIPVVEEELNIGKRQVTAGGVRIYTRVSEQPIEQDVSLRKEHVEVERRPANRPATQQDLHEFKEGTVEITAMSEEPVISKEAKVVEEVLVSKDVSQENQKIRDTVRRSEVKVDDNTGPAVNRETTQHHERVVGQRELAGNGNDDYASDYGRNLARDPRYRGKDWTAIEPDAQREWGTRHKGAWEEFKDRVRHAWEKVTGA